MGEWRALTLQQPHCWAVCHAGKDVENRVWPIPPKLLEVECVACGGSGENAAVGEMRYPMVGEPFLAPAGCEPCGSFGSSGPFRVMLHAGASLDMQEIRSNEFGGRFWTPPTMEMLTLIEWSQNPVHSDPCECDEDEGYLDGKCAELSKDSMRLAFAKDPGAFTEHPIGMDSPKPWCPKCGGDDWVGTYDGQECDCKDEPAEDYNAWVHLGAVVAVVEFTGCHKSIDCVKSTMCGGKHCSPWAEGSTRIAAVYDQSTPEFEVIEPQRDIDLWHWEIGDVTVLDEPVPAKGRQRLWKPDHAVVDAVEAQL